MDPLIETAEGAKATTSTSQLGVLEQGSPQTTGGPFSTSLAAKSKSPAGRNLPYLSSSNNVASHRSASNYLIYISSNLPTQFTTRYQSTCPDLRRVLQHRLFLHNHLFLVILNLEGAAMATKTKDMRRFDLG